MNYLTLIIIFLYFLAIYTITWVCKKKIKNTSDFFLANRELGPFVAALGAGASDMGSFLFMSLPALFYVGGLGNIYLIIGLSVGAFLNWILVASPLRQFTAQKKCLTISSYIEKIFEKDSDLIFTRLLRIITAVAIIFFFIIYSAASFSSAATILKRIIGLEPIYGILIIALCTASYTFIGGFLAINWIDLFQGILMFFVILLVPSLAYFGSDQPLFDVISSKFPDLYQINISYGDAISHLSWGLGYFGQPHILARFMAIDKKSDVPLSQMVCMTWMILALYGALFCGLFGKVVFPNIADPQTIFLDLSDHVLFRLSAGIVLTAIISAVMSTVTAQLLIATSSLTEDIYGDIFKRDKNLLDVSKIFLVIVTFIGSTISLVYRDNSIIYWVEYGWTGLGSSLGPVILMSCCSVKLKAKGAFWGMTLATVIVIIWHTFTLENYFYISSMCPAFITNVAINYYYTSSLEQRRFR